jgi:hypothetical protein
LDVATKTESKAEAVPPNALEQLLSGDPRALVTQLNAALAIMDQTDYCKKHGLNEAGFKGLVVSTLVPFLGKDISMRSETKMGSSYMDLVVETRGLCLGIELKYTPLPFTDPDNYSKYDPTRHIRRTHLHNRKIAIQEMDEKELLALAVTTGTISTNTGSLIRKPISSWMDAAKEQALKCMAKCTTSASKRVVVVLYGVGPRVLFLVS